ncbi:hypothetical protein EJ08DRAFT_681647, partial [Tothia fuscella]
MRFQPISLVIVGAVVVNAVNVKLFDTPFDDNCDESLPYLICQNIAMNKCCYHPEGSLSFSVKVDSMNTETNDFGVVFNKVGNDLCANSCLTDGGVNILCGTCDSSHFPSAGAWFSRPRTLANATSDEPDWSAQLTGRVAADKAGLFDKAGIVHHIKIDDTVPEDLVSELIAAVGKGSTYEDLPLEAKAYEVPV